MDTSYKTDLTPANEHDERCVVHQDRRAIVCDLDTWGRKVPVCEACWLERHERIMQRVLGRALVVGGVRG